jgi:hypothetical protein
MPGHKQDTHSQYPSPLPSVDLHALVATAVGDEVSYAVVISDEVVKASEICTVRRDCKSMVVVFLLPF